MDHDIVQFQDALEALDRVQATRLFQAALTRMTPIHAVEKMLVPALDNIGQAWQSGRIALSQVYMSGRFCEELIEQALPACAPERKTQPRCAIVVLNDYHMLGKRIVYSVMRASGFELLDYQRMEVDELVQRVKADGVKFLLISTLMLPSALKVREVRAALGPEVRIIVGGAPFMFDDNLWREVRADAMGRSATDAVHLVTAWMEQGP